MVVVHTRPSLVTSLWWPNRHPDDHSGVTPGALAKDSRLGVTQAALRFSPHLLIADHMDNCNHMIWGMDDLKPPRLVGDERETVMALLHYQRQSLVKKVLGVGEGAAKQSDLPTGTSLLWLVKHLARAESLWLLHRFAGQDAVIEDDRIGPGDTVQSAVAVYQQTWERTDAVVAAASLDELCRNIGEGPPASLRWVLMHLLEETARHAGHADVLREMIDGETGR